MYNCFEIFIFERGLCNDLIRDVLNIFSSNKSRIIYNGAFYKVTVIFHNSVCYSSFYDYLLGNFDKFTIDIVF